MTPEKSGRIGILSGRVQDGERESLQGTRLFGSRRQDPILGNGRTDQAPHRVSMKVGLLRKPVVPGSR